MGNQHTIGCLSIFDAVAAATHLGLTSVDFPTNVEVSGNDSGSLYEDFQCVTKVNPVATATSKAISQILGFIGISGQCVGAGFDVTKVDVISRRLENCQSALGDTPHIRDRVDLGLLRLGTLTADRGADATITTVLNTLTDGTNAPVARTDGVAMPTPIIAERFTLGLPAIGGVTYPEVDGISLDFQVSITDESPSLGSIWVDNIGVLTVRPVLTLRGRDLSNITNALIAAGADACAHGNTVLQLIRRQESGSFVNFATSAHIAITLAGLVVPENLVSASANQKATTSLRLAAALDDSGNAPVLIDLNSTYDTTPP
jgi:hypothetical protein